jgi:hypothetical protein
MPGDDGGTPTTPAPTDAGTMPEPDAGDAMTPEPPEDAYTACTAATVATDCAVADSSCRETTDPGNLFGTIGVCAPPCSAPTDCPQPAGTYDATLACDNSACRLDCTAPGLSPPLSCPTGMRCVSGIGSGTCFPE